MYNKLNDLQGNSNLQTNNKPNAGPMILTTIVGGENSKNEINITEGDMSVSLVLGDMTQIQADAYVVPHFNGAASFGGVGAAVVRGGALKGMEEYCDIIEADKEKKGKDERKFQEWSTATVTKSGGGNSKFLINVVSVASSQEEEFNVVAKSVSNSLIEANKKGLKTIVLPALGTGIIGNLTTEQAANAIMSGVLEFQKEKGENKSVEKITIAIYGDRESFNVFSEILKLKSYQSASSEVGKKAFNPIEFALGMQNDLRSDSIAFLFREVEKIDTSYYTIEQMVEDGIGGHILSPGEGMDRLIEITSKKSETQAELLAVMTDADKRRKKGKNLAKNGMIDDVLYKNPRSYLKAVVKKYEEIQSIIIGDEFDAGLEEKEKDHIAYEARENTMRIGHTRRMKTLYQDVKAKYQGGFSDELFDTTGLKYYSLLRCGKLFGRFKNDYRNTETDQYLEQQIKEQGFNSEQAATIITSKELYNWHIEEFLYKGISVKKMKLLIDNALKNSHEILENDTCPYTEDIKLTQLDHEIKYTPSRYTIPDKSKEKILLRLFEGKKTINASETERDNLVDKAKNMSPNEKAKVLKDAEADIQKLSDEMDTFLAKESRDDKDTTTVDSIIIGLKTAGDIGEERHKKLLKLIQKKEKHNKKSD